MQDQKKNIVSGIQPTGYLHLGHYLGVLEQFVSLQKDYNCFYMIANYHAMTLFYENYKPVSNFSLSMIALWLACGVNPDKSTIFLQSAVKEHAELYLLLNMYTPLSWLYRNPTYKDKKININKKLESFGFLGYPILQAADILLYKADLVPIGEDQLPHLDITRDIAKRFNYFYKKVFTIPEAKLSQFPKIVGTDGRKMSKSYNNTILIHEQPKEIETKIKKMQTDPARIKRNDPGNPLKCPVFLYYNFFATEKKKDIASQCKVAAIGCIDCKKIIIESICQKLMPIQEKYHTHQNNKKHLIEVLNTGNQKATRIAQNTIQEVKEALHMNL